MQLEVFVVARATRAAVAERGSLKRVLAGTVRGRCATFEMGFVTVGDDAAAKWGFPEGRVEITAGLMGMMGLMGESRVA